MGKRRTLGAVDPTNNNSILTKKIASLEVQMANVLNQSVGVLGEFNIGADGETLVTQGNSLYVSGSDNYVYINGTDAGGEYSVYRLDVRDGGFFVEKTPDPLED
jgi:hypothetical protein